MVAEILGSRLRAREPERRDAECRETRGSGSGHRDVVGNATYPALYLASDATTIYLRMRLDQTPLQGPSDLRSFGWGWLFDADNDTSDYEYLYHLDGTGGGGDTITWWQNTVQASPNDPADPAETPLASPTPVVDFWHVVQAADESGSTEAIIRAVRNSPEGSVWAIGTEIHLVSRLAREVAPARTVVTLDTLGCLCSTMFRISPNHLLWTLDGLVDGEIHNRIVVPEPTKSWAKVALDRMLELA